MMHDWWNWGPGGWGGGMWFGPLLMLLVLLAVIAVSVALVRWMVGAGTAASSMRGTPSAREILDQRFARGDIDGEEYEARKRALEK